MAVGLRQVLSSRLKTPVAPRPEFFWYGGFFRPLQFSESCSIVESRRAAPCLDVAAAFLAFQPALLRSQGRLGRPPRDRPHQSFAQQFEQAVDGIGAVALLGAETLRM